MIVEIYKNDKLVLEQKIDTKDAYGALWEALKEYFNAYVVFIDSDSPTSNCIHGYIEDFVNNEKYEIKGYRHLVRDPRCRFNWATVEFKFEDDEYVIRAYEYEEEE